MASHNPISRRGDDSSRRRFLGQVGRGAVAGGVAWPLLQQRAAGDDTIQAGRVAHRTLGKTELDISEIGFGGHSWSYKRVPAGLIVLEKTITLNTMSRRPDIVIRDRQGKAVMVVECKAPEVKVSQAAFDQVARYNAVLRVPYLVVTNGLEHYCCRMEFARNTYTFLQEIPDYSSMTGVQD